MGVLGGLILKPTSLIPRNGLVAEYLFNNNYLDTSGKGENGTNFGTTFATDRKSQANSAIALNGIDQYVTIPLVMPGEFTISAWVKLTNLALDRAIIGNFGDQFLLYLDIGGGGDGYRTLVRDSDSNLSNTPTSENSATTSWQNVIVTYEDGANGLNLYVNNDLKESVTGSSGIDSSLNSIAFGVDSSVELSRWMLGLLDDIRIWSRVLGASERTAVFQE